MILIYTLSVQMPETNTPASTYELDGNYLIGRSSFCDIVIPNKFVSGVHCTLILMPPDSEHHFFYYVIKDGNIYTGDRSLNGTWVNGLQVVSEFEHKRNQLSITSVELRHEDVIAFGGKQAPKAVFKVQDLEGLEGDETGTFSEDI